ncbi:MAG TPA: hypothetical protein P5256_02660 [Beijerinckiaceae bacterium]|nr:hypothetical protein [Beijerinckiaceae bacterium]
MRLDALMAHLPDLYGNANPATLTSSPPPDALAAAEAAAYARGLEDGAAQSRELAAEALASAAAKMDTVRDEWTAAWCERLTAEIERGRAKLEENLSQQLADVLMPVISDVQRERVRQAFITFLRRSIPQGCECHLVVAGPVEEEEIMLESLRKAGIEASYRVSDSRFLETSWGHAFIGADFGEWVNQVKGVFSGSGDV